MPLRIRFPSSVVLGLCLLGLPLVSLADSLRPVDPAMSTTTASAPVVVGAGLDLSVTALQARVKKLQASEATPDDSTTEAIRLYSDAIDQLELASEWKQRSDALARLQREGARMLEATRRDVEAWSKQVPATVSGQLSRSELEGLLAETDARLSVVRKGLLEVDAEQSQLGERRLTLPAEIATVGAVREGLLGELGLPPLPTGSIESTLAHRALALATRKATADQAGALELEMATYEIRRELLAARRDLLKRKSETYVSSVSELQAALASRRVREAEAAAADARADQASLARVHPVLGSLAEENAKLTGQRTGPDGLSAKMDAATRELSSVSDQLQRLEERSKGVRQKVAAAGLTDAIGMLLRKEREELGSVERVRAELRVRHDQIAAVQLQALNLEDSLRALPALESEVDVILKTQGDTIAAADHLHVETSARNVLEARRASLEALLRDTNSYFATLVDLDAKESELVRVLDDYRAFLDQHVLWIPNASMPSLVSVADWRDAALWIVDPRNHAKSAARLLSAMEAETLRFAVGLLLLASSLAYRRRLKSLYAEACALRRVDGLTGLPVPLVAVLAAVALALPGPFIARVLAWMLEAAPYPPDDFSHALAGVLRALAFPLLVAEFLRRAAGKDGPAVTFLGWPRTALALLRKQIVLGETVALPLFAISGLLDLQPEDNWSETVGRAAFCAAVAVVALGLQRLLAPKGSVVEQVVSRTDLQWMRPLLVHAARLPMLLAVLVIGIATAGYYYTSFVLVQRLWLSGLTIFLFLVANAATLRWLAARQLVSGSAVADDEAVETETPATTVAFIEKVSAEKVSAQTRSLLRLVFGMALAGGLFSVWVDVFPALRFFEKIELWQVGALVEKTVGTGDAVRFESVEVQVPVTLANLLIALFGAVLAIVGARNIPALIELALLSRLQLDRGLRYAIATVTRYAVFLAGAVVALNNLGVEWSNVQWLVAAVSVGLGFGLQEIFGNFVSGLIVLFERPVRVGDQVTIGGVTGIVARIEMRATTIVDLDRKELIVPNKELITGTLVNWTLADTMVRLVIPLGVAYGSDVAAVTRILLEVAKQSPMVLENPPPMAFFLRFGESSLDFELRVFLGHPDALGSTRHELLTQIERRLRAASIGIPFPQRDLHLRSVDDSAAAALAPGPREKAERS